MTVTNIMSAPAHMMGLVTSEAELMLSAAICQEKLLEVVLRGELCWQTSNTRPNRDQLGCSERDREILNTLVIIHCDEE